MTTMAGGRGAREQGSSTVLVVALVAAAALLASGILLWASAGRAAMQAAAAADLAALAAADTARGLRPGDPCTVAADVARANHASLAECTVEPDGITVRVAASVPVGFSALGLELHQATAKARAGAPPLERPAS